MPIDHAGPAANTLTSLLRAEESALEIYQSALARADGRPAGQRLRQICVDHVRAVQVLLGLLLRHGDDAPAPTTSADPFAAPVADEDAELTALVRSLRAGEARQVEEYRRALSDPNLTIAAKALIRSDLLRRSETHVPALDALIDKF